MGTSPKTMKSPRAREAQVGISNPVSLKPMALAASNFILNNNVAAVANAQETFPIL